VDRASGIQKNIDLIGDYAGKLSAGYGTQYTQQDSDITSLAWAIKNALALLAQEIAELRNPAPVTNTTYTEDAGQ